MLEAHFSSLPAQSSIYGITSLGRHIVLVASSKRKVYFVDCCRNTEGQLIASMKEVAFTYIPGGAEIISIDAFYQTCYGYIVGIAFIKCNSNGKQTRHFNMYSAWEPSTECELDIIAQGCLSLSLDFVPFHLTHTTLIDNGSTEMVWLLSGSDNKVHLYREDKSRQIFCEDPHEDYFPEFKDLNSVILWIDFVLMPESRITAYGCKNGWVIVTVVNIVPGIHTQKGQIIIHTLARYFNGREIKISATWSIEHDGPISCVQLYKDTALDLLTTEIGDDQKVKSDVPFHLFVGNTLEVSVVYRDILRKGLSSGAQWLLPNSGRYDCVTCCCIADIDMDGENELLVGTYGQEFLIYKWKPENQENKGSYSLFYQQAFSSPILAITYVDITRDGLREILVLSTKGLHILQHNLKKVMELCIEELKDMVQEKQMEPTIIQETS